MRLSYIAFFLALGTASAAQTVTTSIPPLAGMINDLTRGVTTAQSLLPPNTDPHHFNMAPSQIKTIHSAARIYAIGQEMEPWLERLEPQLAEGSIVYLGEIEAVHPYILEARQFGGAPESEHEEDAHADEHGDEHAHGVNDPHMWLSPAILGVWAEQVVNDLAADTPEHADMLNANLAAYKADLAQIDSEMTTLSAAFAAQDIQIVVTHDAFQYLETYLGLTHVGMFSDIQDNAAGARSISSISRLTGDICLIVDPNEQTPEGVLSEAKQAQIDPLGTAFIGQERFTLGFFKAITQALSSCL